jgi:hypothetical protein
MVYAGFTGDTGFTGSTGATGFTAFTGTTGFTGLFIHACRCQIIHLFRLLCIAHINIVFPTISFREVSCLQVSLEETLHDSRDQSCHRSFGCHWLHWKYRCHRIYRCYGILWGHRCSIPPRCLINSRKLKITLYIYFQVD